MRSREDNTKHSPDFLMSHLPPTGKEEKEPSSGGHTQTNTLTIGATSAEREMERHLQLYQQRHDEQMQAMQQQMQALTALLTQAMAGAGAVPGEEQAVPGAGTRQSTGAIRTSAPAARSSADTTSTPRPAAYSPSSADTLPTPRPTVHFPTTAARNGTHNRPSFGIVEPLEFDSPTPARAATAHDSNRQAADLPAPTSSAAADRRELKDILAMMKGFVEPFYADKTKDKSTTVMDFVEKIETVMSDVIGDEPRYRWTIVRFFLAEGAMRWGNNKQEELHARAVLEGRDMRLRPIDWDTEIRRDFIKAHVGPDSADTWLAKLGALRLGSKATPTPIELENQFDTIARHIYPTTMVGDDRSELLLAKYWNDIVSLSQPKMHEEIIMRHTPSTLREWKTATVKQWNAFETLKVARTQQRAAAGTSWNRSPGDGRGFGGGWRGRANQGADRPAPASVASMSSTDGAGPEGQQSSEEGEPDEQLSAASHDRSGRGGRQTNFRSADIEKLYREGRCFICKEKGHMKDTCPKKPEQQQHKQQQGKAKAGQ